MLPISTTHSELWPTLVSDIVLLAHLFVENRISSRSSVLDSFDPQRLADISLFLTQAFEAWTSKSLICYGEEDLHCRFFFLYDIMDRNYSTRRYLIERLNTF